MFYSFRSLFFIAAVLEFVCVPFSPAQEVDEEQVGAWYMYFFGTQFEDSRWGIQGDAQYRNWDSGGDLEQLLLRSGVTYRPESVDGVFTLGYANITSGAFGDSSSTSGEDRVYQEASLPQQLGSNIHLRHRFRYEQRWVEDQDFRTRFRYALFANVPLNQDNFDRGAWYLSAYNEIFINGERKIGDGREVERYDRNRLYGAIGHSLRDNMKLQLGYMYQDTDNTGKGQVQFSLHHNF